MLDPALPLIERAFDAGAGEFECYVLAWGRVLPTVLLVPAFGLRSLGAPVRVAIGFVLAVGAAAALRPVGAGSPWAIAWMLEFARGLPVAVGAAATLWLASMTGAMVDDLRPIADGLPETLPGGGSGAFSVLFGIFAALAFLETGGPARVVVALFLSDSALTEGAFVRVAMNLVSGIAIAVSVAAPVVVAAMLLELAIAFWGRVSGGVAVPVGSGSIRAMAVVTAVAWLLQRILGALTDVIAAAP